jgi:putative two-component system response regulator
MSHEQALSIMSKGRGTHFDPDMLDAFLQCHEDFQAIARKYSDDEQ